MKIDNLQAVLPFLEFESEDDFYFLQILQRRKENPFLKNNSRVIKNYYVRSPEYLEKKFDEIVTLCDAFKARAGIRLNRRSLKQTACRAMVKMANVLECEAFDHAYNVYDKAAGATCGRHEKKWLLDVDDVEPGDIEEAAKKLAATIYEYAPHGGKSLGVVRSLTGFHLITVLSIRENSRTIRSCP